LLSESRNQKVIVCSGERDGRFYLHDRGLHARFDAIDKRLDEIRKRLAIEY
jgi:hypothetical protein